MDQLKPHGEEVAARVKLRDLKRCRPHMASRWITRGWEAHDRLNAK